MYRFRYYKYIPISWIPHFDFCEMGEVYSDYPWISIPFTSFDASTTGSRPPELHRLLQDSTGIRTHCGCACGVVLRVQPLISQKIWSVDFECSDKCMVLRCFIMFSAQRFQLRYSKIDSQVLRVSCHDLGPSAVNLAVHSNPQSCHPASGNSCD